MNNFQVNLLNLLHCFSEIHERLEKKEETDFKKKTINYYDYMSAFFSIYLDISLELSSKLEYKKIIENNHNHLSKDDLCLNMFYLLGKYLFYIVIII